MQPMPPELPVRHAAELSVVVPTCERRDAVERLLRALLRQTLPPERFEVLVAIDGSEDGTRELVESFRSPYRLRGLWRPHGGRASACNRGARAATGHVVVFLDDDMEPLPGCLAAHRAAHDGRGRRCVLGAVPVAVPVAERESSLHRYVARKFEAHHRRLAGQGHRFTLRDFYSGNLSIPRSLLLEVGLFDEEFAAYGNEDLELAVRLRRAGVAITFDEDAVAVQHWEKNLARLASDTRAKGETVVLLARKHPDALPELQLSRYANAGLVWRLARAALVWAGPAPGWARAVIAFTTLLDRIRFPRTILYYRLVLDSFYWLGVRSALRRGGSRGSLGHALSRWSARETEGLPLHR
jgi:GT2 family glycosyltransferase